MFKPSVHYKCRHINGRPESSEYTTAPITLESKAQEKYNKSIEIQEEKDKDYYFMDASQIGLYGLLICSQHLK